MTDESKKEDVFKDMPNHIFEFVQSSEENEQAITNKQLFSASEEDIDFKTDLSEQEVRDITVLFYNDKILFESGLEPVFRPYYDKFLRLVVSKDRQGRSEFVQVNKNQSSDDVIEKTSQLNSILGSKK